VSSLSPLEAVAAQQAALAPDGPNGLGRPTHVLLDGASGMFVAWRGRAAGDPNPFASWTMLRVGYWHARFDGSSWKFIRQPTARFVQLTMPASMHSLMEIDLASLRDRVEQEAPQGRVDTGRDNFVTGTVRGTVVQARDIHGDVDLVATVADEKFTEEQQAALDKLWPLISDIAAANLPANRVVIATPRTWPQVLHWEGYPVRRMPVTRPMLLVAPIDVDTPIDGM
jgi:hypothetical protein